MGAGVGLKADANCFAKGDPVSWHYRSAIGHGYVTSVARQEDSCAETLYNVRQVDNHPGEPATVKHTGAALSHSTREAVEAAAEAARRRDEGKAVHRMIIKSVPIGSVKAGPEDGLAEGEFVVYPSTFTRQPDAYGDVVKAGAFADTIAEWQASGNTLPGLYGHRLDDPDFFVASAIEMAEDDHGWRVKGAFDLDSPKGPQVYRLVKGRRLSQLSFAYDVLDEGEVTLEDGTKANELRRLKVYEFSFVPVGANQDTSVVAVKALAQALTEGVKEGRVLAAKHIDSLRKAQEAIGVVIEAATGGDQEKASGKPAAGDEGLREVKSAAPSHNPSVNDLALAALLEVELTTAV